MQGYKRSAYSVSKAAVTAYTRILAKEFSGKNIMVFSMCPGSVQTEMSRGRGSKSVSEGADTIVYLATTHRDELNGKSGLFFCERKPTNPIDTKF